MMAPLKDESLRILRVLLECGTTRGFELKRKVELKPGEFVDAVRPLIESQLVAASGNVTPETIDRVQFSPLSAAQEKSGSWLK